jgi:FkbM family methyltransferase
MYEKVESFFFNTPHGNPIVMTFRKDTNDWNTLYSCLEEDEYLLPAGLSGRALDIGGHIGSVGIALALDNPDLHVTIVEPVPPNADLIERNIRENRVWNRVRLVRGAVGKGTVRVRYGFSGNESAEHHRFIGNSMLAGDSTYIPLDLVGLGIRSLVGNDEVAFTKIDTEGAEYDFLDDPAVSQLVTIAGEWHNNDGHVIGDILALLDKTHVVSFTGPQTGPGGFRAERR